MHLIQTTQDKGQMTDKPPFGPGFAEDEVARAARMEVWGTSCNDPCPDYCRFVLFDEAGNELQQRTVEGY